MVIVTDFRRKLYTLLFIVYFFNDPKLIVKQEEKKNSATLKQLGKKRQYCVRMF